MQSNCSTFAKHYLLGNLLGFEKIKSYLHLTKKKKTVTGFRNNAVRAKKVEIDGILAI